MQLDRLILKNYRCFDDINMSIHPQLTVIVAENGQGKSTILDAIRVGLWPFINSFDLARSSTFNDPSNSIAIADVRLLKTEAGDMVRQLPTQLALEGDWGQGQPRQWMRYRESEANKTKTRDDEQTAEMKHWAGALQAQIRDPNQAAQALPVFGYYGTGRLWAQKKLTEIKKNEKDDSDADDFYVRTFGYRNCMDPASSYKHFREWFIWAWESYSNMLMRTQVPDSEKQMAQARIQVVQGAIDAFLRPSTGWHTLEYSIEDQKTLILNHDDLGRMHVDLLSDGIRSMLALVGDIAYRCVKLNPHMGTRATEESCGVVLIDEVDMHLHPRWQQMVLTQLQAAFPRIQFIVTTHSPQVLTTVKPESIRGLKTVDGCIQVRDDYPFSEGAEAQQVLQDILGVAARPGELPIVQDLQAYLDLIHQDQWDSAQASTLRARLNAWSSGHEAVLMQADMDIRLRQFRRSKRDTNKSGT